jgi:hypothetical protein
MILSGLSGSSKAGLTPASTKGVVIKIAKLWITINKRPMKKIGKISFL